MNELNERFIMTPIALLEIPEFVRYFDAKPIGAVYRVLCSRVWRKPREALRKNSSKRIKMLTDRYENGLLVSMHTLKSLSESVGYDERSVRRQLKDLLLLGLIDQEKELGEVFYIVGETRLRGRDKNNLSIGSSNESFYINRWRDFVNYSAEYKPEVLELFKKEIVSFFKNGQTCQILLTDLSKVLDLNELRNLVSDAENEIDEAPLIDKVIQINSTDLNLTNLNDYELSRIRSEVRKEILDAYEIRDILSTSRDALSNRVFSLAEINSFISSHVPESQKKYERLPRFAINLDSVLNDPSFKEHTKIVIFWSSLREDMSGVYVKSSQKEYSKMMGVAKKVLQQYPYEQVLWTIKKIAYNGGSDLEFLIKGIHTLAHMVSKNAKEFNEIKNEERRVQDSVKYSQSKKESFEDSNYHFEDPFGEDFHETPAHLIFNFGGIDE